MTASISQRQFNPFRDFSKRTRPDIWHRVPKHEKRENVKALVYTFLIDGGKIERIPTKSCGGPGRPQIFARDGARTSTAEYQKYYKGWREGDLAITGKIDGTDKAAAARLAKMANSGEYVVEIAGELRKRDAGSRVAAKPEPRGKDEADHITATAGRDDAAWSERRERLIRAPEHPRFDSGAGNGPVRLAA